MKLTWKTLMLAMMAPAVLVILYLLICQQPVERWQDLPVVVKVLVCFPMAGLGYMVMLAVVGLVKKWRGR